jgi:CheY-like chemotaxis protein
MRNHDASMGVAMDIHPIIFVDDNSRYLRLVETIVEQTGIYAHYATSGEEALRILQENPCEIMFTDLNMPGMDGYKLSKLAREILPGIRIFMVTAAASPYVSRLAAQIGISKVITKPNRADQLREMVKEATPAAWIASQHCGNGG